MWHFGVCGTVWRGFGRVSALHVLLWCVCVCLCVWEILEQVWENECCVGGFVVCVCVCVCVCERERERV